MNNTTLHTGRVILVAAGPGDPDLITMKAVQHLQQADVVLADRLVSPEIMERYAPQASVIMVGKQCRRGKSTPQATINELMVEHAQAGAYVVRLKGGDVSVFSNISDELETLYENNISYEIVPGVTAALGAAAYAGIPLTARNMSRGIRFLTYYKKEAIDNSEWKCLAHTGDTLVFYMSAETYKELVQNLLDAGMPGHTPLLVAEQATTPLQNFNVSTLENCMLDWAGRQFVSPSLIIIGEVVSLHSKYAWSSTVQVPAEYFEPVI